MPTDRRNSLSSSPATNAKKEEAKAAKVVTEFEPKPTEQLTKKQLKK